MRSFAPSPGKACWQYLVLDRPATEVAAELKISVALRETVAHKIENAVRDGPRVVSNWRAIFYVAERDRRARGHM